MPQHRATPPTKKLPTITALCYQTRISDTKKNHGGDHNEQHAKFQSNFEGRTMGYIPVLKELQRADSFSFSGRIKTIPDLFNSVIDKRQLMAMSIFYYILSS